MKRLIISLIAVLLCTTSLFSQKEKYDKRIDDYQSFWTSLIPTHYKLQFAGNMGLFSLGIGWDYGKRNQWETDVYVGFVPKYTTDHNKITFTVKQNFLPWNIKLGDKGFSFEPLTCGIYVNTVSGNEFWSTDPDRYPKGYYNISTKIRFNAFVGQRITLAIPDEKLSRIRSITFFYEISTCDLYVISAFQNSYLKPSDYLGLSLGLKFQIF